MQLPVGFARRFEVATAKWEYIFLRGSPGPGTATPAYINGQSISDSRVTRLTICQYANQLGEHGWEVVSSDVEGKRIVFKRPKA